MADIFISFKTDDTARVQPVFDGFRSRGLTVFWSNDIPKGAPNYQAILKDEILEAPVVVVVWTNASVHSGPVIQECSQAEKTNKLFQVLLDDIEPMDMPMEVKYKSQKTMLLGWEGDPLHPEWIKLNNAIDARLGRVPIPVEVGIRGTSETKLLLPGAGKIEWFKDSKRGPEMVLVPSGSFIMGSSQNEPGHVDDEEPQHKVIISQPFAVGRHAVTCAQFAAFVKATKYRAGNANEGEYWAPSWREPGIRQDGSHPVVCVSWDDAKAYASWLAQATGKRYRLLSESEREYVTRAGTKTPYWCGSSITTAQANFDNAYVDSEKHDPEEDFYPEDVDIYGDYDFKARWHKATTPVGSFESNPWGIYDLHGNVLEWCEDVWNDGYKGAPSDGSAWLQGSDDRVRVLRGGSWSNHSRILRSAFRYKGGAGYGDRCRGFRVARALGS